MSPEEKLFLNTIDDLKTKIERLTQYDLLKCSGLIRLLLLDSPSLVDQVNRVQKIKITYRVNKRHDWPELEPLPDGTKPRAMFTMMFILPQENSNSVENLNIKDFLKYELLSNEEQDFTVLDIIKICANKYGGVHSENVKKPEDLLLDDLHHRFKFNDSSSILHALYSISKICLIALQPLVDSIHANPSC